MNNRGEGEWVIVGCAALALVVGLGLTVAFYGTIVWAVVKVVSFITGG
jgi:hypothetical protein